VFHTPLELSTARRRVRARGLEAPTAVTVERRVPSRGARKWKPIAIAGLCLLLQSAQATQLLQDCFNYPPGGDLAGNGPWLHDYSYITVGSNSLTYPGLADAAPASYEVSVLLNPNLGSASTPFYTYSPFTVVSNGAVYASFLLNYPLMSGSPNYTFMGLLPASGSGPGNGGTFNNTYDPCDLAEKAVSGGYTLGVRSYGQGATYASGVLALNTTNLIVLKYDFASRRASLFINPSVTGAEPATPDASSVGSSAATSIGQIYFRAAGNQAAGGGVSSPPFLVDTLRVGTTWAEVVVAVPQTPATKLVFTTQPGAGVVGSTLSPVVVQLRNEGDLNISSNNVPVTVSLSAPGAFAGGATTVYSDTNGQAVFNDLAVGTPGNFTLTATASGIAAGLAPATSGLFPIGSPHVITNQGPALSTFLDSLDVETYWANGLWVDWLTGGKCANNTLPNSTSANASHCSAFAAAVATLLGVYILHQSDTVSDVNLANNQANWLASNPMGWSRVQYPTNAQALANIGTLVVASYYDPNQSGHIAVLRPSTKSDAEILAVGPEICQSGIHNYNDTNAMTGFGVHPNAFATNGIRYYCHIVTSPIAPVNPALGWCSSSNGVFHCSATSVVGRKYLLQWSANLATWNDLKTFINPVASTNFWCVAPLNDTSAPGVPGRFYRLLAQ
jgi:hypothetical protein